MAPAVGVCRGRGPTQGRSSLGCGWASSGSAVAPARGGPAALRMRQVRASLRALARSETPIPPMFVQRTRCLSFVVAGLVVAWHGVTRHTSRSARGPFQNEVHSSRLLRLFLPRGGVDHDASRANTRVCTACAQLRACAARPGRAGGQGAVAAPFRRRCLALTCDVCRVKSAANHAKHHATTQTATTNERQRARCAPKHTPDWFFAATCAQACSLFRSPACHRGPGAGGASCAAAGGRNEHWCEVAPMHGRCESSARTAARGWRRRRQLRVPCGLASPSC